MTVGELLYELTKVDKNTIVYVRAFDSHTGHYFQSEAIAVSLYEAEYVRYQSVLGVTEPVTTTNTHREITIHGRQPDKKEEKQP